MEMDYGDMAIDVDWLRRRAKQNAPFEACGFIFDDDEIVEIRNVAINPMREFKMDLRQANEAIQGKIISAIWHTHPSGSSIPSSRDMDAIFDGAILQGWSYLIVTAEQVTEWNPNMFAPQEHSFWEAFAK